MLVWATTSSVLLAVSSAATLLTTLHLRCRWDVHVSSVRWLFWLFFLFVFLWCSLRAVFFMWLASHGPHDLADDKADMLRTYEQIDRRGIHSLLYLKETKHVWYVILLGAGDVALLGIALTLFPLTYELARLARISMDRGVPKERTQIKRYRIAITVGLGIYSVVFTVLASVTGGYTESTYDALLVVYVIEFLALAYMAFQLIRLKINGREYETIQGTFVVSPIYHRLQLIMLVYAVFVFQFQVMMMIMTVTNIDVDSDMGTASRISKLVYNASGLALAITTSCSQACLFSTCAPFLPEGFEAEFLHHRFMTVPTDDLEPPSENPVFVYTDIESSSALWNTGGDMMGVATEIHDGILRSSLIKHRGYEVTTVGDAFQIAFHSIRDAIEYCLDVQLQLLVANWPKEIDGAVPATVKERVGRRVVFNGLRVRMGIHDAHETDGPLVQDVHAVTGKATYTGLSEVIAEYVGDLGSGGQILMTGRVATWLKHHRQELSLDVFLEYLGEYPVPQVSTDVTLYQVLPMMLADRRKHFGPLRTEFMAMHRHIRLSQRGQSSRYLWSATTTPVISSAVSEADSLESGLSPVVSVNSACSDDLDEDRVEQRLLPKEPVLDAEPSVNGASSRAA